MANPATVLLALSDLVEQAQLEQALVAAGYAVLAAADADDVLAMAERQRPSAIIVSAEIGGPEGGTSLCHHLKASPTTRSLAVIMVCGRERALCPTDGTDGLPDEVLVRPLHAAEAVLRVATVQRLHRYASEALQGSRLDSLTGTFSHGYLLDRLRHEVLRAERYGRSVALVMLDLDGFGAINQREGTTCGDLLLREVARAVTSRLRGVDLVARSGGDELSVVLPETSLLVARPIAERLRSAVAGLGYAVPGDSERRVQITVSLGVAGFPHPEVSDVPSLLRCARAALNRAREAGGDRAELY